MHGISILPPLQCYRKSFFSFAGQPLAVADLPIWLKTQPFPIPFNKITGAPAV